MEVFMRRLLLTAVLLLSPLAATADALKISQLEADVRDLRRQVQSLSQQVGDLTTRPPRPAGARAPAPSPAAANAVTWVDAARWSRLRLGMSELEVIGILGPPTTMRDEGGAKVLRYAMEIGPTGFLAGSVTLRDRVVAEVRKPALQ
jgi:outer membrane murein-binding lipoprotein Lpp